MGFFSHSRKVPKGHIRRAPKGLLLADRRMPRPPKGVGGAGAGACSGDLLLGALAACAQITCQMVAAAMGILTERIEVTVEGDLDLRGTLRHIKRRDRRV